MKISHKYNFDPFSITLHNKFAIHKSSENLSQINIKSLSLIFMGFI